MREKLRSAFEALAWDDRLAIAARYLAGLPRAEAATLMDADPDDVERRLQVALEHLAKRTEDARFATMPADRLGVLAIATVLGEVTWSPNVAPSVTDRLLRDAIAYPDQFGPTRRLTEVVSAGSATTLAGQSPSARTGRRGLAGPVAHAGCRPGDGGGRGGGIGARYRRGR